MYTAVNCHVAQILMAGQKKKLLYHQQLLVNASKHSSVIISRYVYVSLIICRYAPPARHPLNPKLDDVEVVVLTPESANSSPQ